MLHGTIGIQEVPAQVGDLAALPGHDHSRLFRDHSHPVGLQVFLLGGGNKGRHIFRCNHNGHTLLRLGNGQLCAVQAVVLLPHGVQVNPQAVGQLADGHGDTAGAKVIAALNQSGDIAVPEQPLNLPLLRSVALLDLGGHGGQGLHIVALG